MKTYKQTVSIKTDDKDAQPMELIAKSIIDISTAFEKIKNSKLQKRAIILLLYDACNGKIGKRDIELIIDTAPKLAKIYTK